MKVSNFEINGLKTQISSPRTAMLCPVCNNEITLIELIEREGYVGCVNCSR